MFLGWGRHLPHYPCSESDQQLSDVFYLPTVAKDHTKKAPNYAHLPHAIGNDVQI